MWQEKSQSQTTKQKNQSGAQDTTDMHKQVIEAAIKIGAGLAATTVVTSKISQQNVQTKQEQGTWVDYVIKRDPYRHRKKT